MKFKFFLAIFIILVIQFSVYATEHPFTKIVDAESASFSTTAFSPLGNPVFSDLSSIPDIAYRIESTEEKKNQFFMMNLSGFSLIYSRYNFRLNDTSLTENNKGNILDVSKGLFFGNFFGIGLGYKFLYKNDFVKYSSWRGGLLFRPSKYFSLGYYITDCYSKINDKSLKREENYSLSIRPYFERLTLTSDLKRLQGDGVEDIKYSSSMHLRMFYNISLFAKVDSSKNVFFGINIPLSYKRDKSETMNVRTFSSYESNSYTPGIEISASTIKNNNIIGFSEDVNLLLIKINNKVKELEKEDFFGIRKIIFREILTGIEKAKNDENISGIILEIDNPELGVAQIEEIRNEIKKFKKTGKKVYSIIKSVNNRSYYLAASANKIYMPPNVYFTLKGLSASVYFYKGFLDSIGLKYESVKRGKFKSFSEAFVNKGMSKEFRENLTTLLKIINNKFISDIVKDRKMSEDDFNKVFAMGVLSPEESKKLKYIDEIEYPAEAIEKISKNKNIIKLYTYLNEKKMSYSWGGKKKIAIIYFTGAIVSGKSTRNNFINNIGDETYRKMLFDAFSDSSVKAVVIRINSGGGSALASDYMWKYLHEMKDEFNKPVVFSFGNMAASGGYYIACTGDTIFADKLSIAGSIGVTSGKISAKELYAKLGITKEIIKMSEFADIFTESRDFNKKERVIAQKGVDFIYNLFTGRVVKARKISQKDIPHVAEGRIFTGEEAKKNKLVDQNGGLLAAIEFARKLSKIKGEFEIKELPNLESSIKDIFTSSKTIQSKELRSIIDTIGILSSLNSQILYLLPYRIVIE